MTFSTTQSTSRDKIVQLLSGNSSLTAKQIHQRLQREFAVASSYQATHKTLKQMLEERVVLKGENGYIINPGWVENFKNSADQLAEKVKSGISEIDLSSMVENESIHLSFKGILEVGWFLIDQFMDAPNPDKKPCLALWRFCYSIIGLEARHLSGLKRAFAKNDWFTFVEGTGKVDRMFGDTLISYGGKKIVYGVKCATPLSDKMIIGDYIAEINYPSNFRKIWALQNSLPKQIVEFNLAKHFFQMREMQPKIEVIVTKNGKLADEFREEYLVESKSTEQ